MKRKKLLKNVIVGIIAVCIVFGSIIGVHCNMLKSKHFSVYRATEKCMANRPAEPLFGSARIIYNIKPGDYILQGHTIGDINPISPIPGSYYYHYYFFYYETDSGLTRVEVEDVVMDTFEYCGEITQFDYRYTNWEKKFD